MALNVYPARHTIWYGGIGEDESDYFGYALSCSGAAFECVCLRTIEEYDRWDRKLRERFPNDYRTPGLALALIAGSSDEQDYAWNFIEQQGVDDAASVRSFAARLFNELEQSRIP